MNCGLFKVVLGAVCVLAFGANAAENPLDTFGIKKMFKTAAGTVEWNSAHWANGKARDLNWSGDPHDVTGWTDNHSGGSADPYFKVDGNVSGQNDRFRRRWRRRIRIYDEVSV